MIFCVTAFSASQGLTYPLLTLLMERNGETASAIALNAAMTPFGIIASAPLINRYASRLRSSAFIASAIGGSAFLLLLIGLVRDPTAWLLLRFLLGCSINVVYVLSEAVLLAIAPPSHRGRLMGAYTSITNLGYALGPLILVAAGSSGMAPFLVLAAILVAAAAPLFFVTIDRNDAQAQDDARVPLHVFLRSGGLLVAAYAATTLVDNGFMSLFPAFGLRLGLHEAEISVILFCLFLGGALAQVPIGWVIDRTSVLTALAACSLIGIAGFPLFSALMPAAKPAMALAFVWGGALLGVQTVALAEMGKRYSGAMLLAGNATLALMWGVSGIVGIPVTGYAMDTLGPYGLPIVVGAVFTAATLAFVAQVFTAHRSPSRTRTP